MTFREELATKFAEPLNAKSLRVIIKLVGYTTCMERTETDVFAMPCAFLSSRFYKKDN